MRRLLKGCASWGILMVGLAGSASHILAVTVLALGHLELK